MAESSLSVSKTEIDILIADYLGYGRTSGSWGTAQTARIGEARKAGILRFYNQHDWSFMAPVTTVTLTEDDGSDDAEDDFGSLRDTFYYAADTGHAPLIVTSVGEIKRMISLSDASGHPTHVAVNPKSQTGDSGSRYEFLWYPYPDSEYVMTYAYNVLRDDLSSSYPYPAGGAAHRNTVIAACLAEAEKLYDDTQGLWEQTYRDRVAESWKQDARLRAKSLGLNRDRSDGPVGRNSAVRYCTYEGSVGT